MGMSWTKEQRMVIDTRNANMLVSAAAGSGKTAVLVERIITRLTSTEQPLDVDRLLVVTFTEAAAAEMKGRIRDAIDKILEEYPENEHMQRQAALIHSARIMTIHSFCLSVIREHFHTIDLDPGFRTAEEGELKLLKHDVLEELLELHYEAGEEDFLKFVECFASGRDDKKLEEILLNLYEFSRSYPNPSQWFTECLEVYGAKDEETFEQTRFVGAARRNIERYLEDALHLVDQGLALCYAEDGPTVYAAALEADREGILDLKEADTFLDMNQKAAVFKWERLASLRKKEGISEQKMDQVKAIRSDVKELIGDLKKYYFYTDNQSLFHDMQECYPVVQVLTGLVAEFEAAFTNKKRERNIIDFSDMEHLALRILTREEAGELVPSEAAEGYQEQLSEIMIDEYQDSNMLQEVILTSVSSVRCGIYNIFMVGDVKQSIYRFRLAKPELFMEKFEAYPTADHCCRIDLHKNFRSRLEVLDSVNFIFEQVMTKELGGITYDSTARLNVGAAYETRSGNETEVILVHTDGIKDAEVEIEDSERELEARAAARRIKELMKDQQIRDKDSGEYRPIRYRDIVILTRSLKGWTNVFADILKREGIPTYTGSKEGYFETLEIGILLNYLRVLDNQKQDLPLASVLKSPIGGLTNGHLATIRSKYPELLFHEAVTAYAKGEGEPELIVKLRSVLDQIEEYRRILPFTAIHVLLWKIIKETGYGEYMAALPGGAQRKANIDMLVEKAIAYEATSYKGLFHFVRYIEQLQKYEVDYGEASLTDEQADAVRLMSIHKSKGLEFPVVIVAGMSKPFNTQDSRAKIVVHPNLGIGIDAVDLKDRTKSPSLLKKVIQKELILENLGEELRVLYVALTRAKEKLIMLGTVKEWEKRQQADELIRSQPGTTLSFGRLAGAGSYYDWVLPSLVRMDPSLPLTIRHLQAETIAAAESSEAAGDLLAAEALREWDTRKTYDEEFAKQLEEQFSYQYPYSEEKQLKLKYTVSELKQLGGSPEETGELLFEEPEIIPLIPKFLTEETEMAGASRGSAYHKLLELLDFTVSYDRGGLLKALDDFEKRGLLSREMKECIRPEDILQFLSSDLAGRMQAAAKQGMLKSEQPFVIGVDAGYLVQGIIDVYFEEEDGLVIADYKTDRVDSGAQLREKYHVQLDYYAQALEKLTLKKVKEKIIYAFAVHEEVEI